MKRHRATSAVLAAMVLLSLAACGAEYSNPPVDFDDPDLVGTWEARYGAGLIDRLVFRADGKFRQTYHDRSAGYSFETPWNRWWVERFPDGRARVHLPGARFYAAGIQVGEREGMQPPEWGPKPWPFWDPIALEFVTMTGELVLNVQREAPNGLVLLRMLEGSSAGWISAWTGKASDAFRRVDSP